MNWNNEQATIHPYMITHRVPVQGLMKNDLKHLRFVIISYCMTHNKIAVHRLQGKLAAFLKEQFPVSQVIYFSDGAASQYKNRKNSVNRAYHEEYCGFSAEWHFSSTSHGKGPCYGVGGTVKRVAARASLQRPYQDQLQTPLQLYQWAKENIPSVTFVYVPQAEYEEESKMIEMRLSTSKRIEGTQKLHSFLTVPGSKTKLMAKVYSASDSSTKAQVSTHVTRMRCPGMRSMGLLPVNMMDNGGFPMF